MQRPLCRGAISGCLAFVACLATPACGPSAGADAGELGPVDGGNDAPSYAFSLDRSVLDFGDSCLGEATTVEVALTNRGTAPLVGLSIELRGELDSFSVDGSACERVEVHRSCAISVVATPRRYGGTTSTLEVSLAGQHEEVQLALAGASCDHGPSIFPAPERFEDTVVGEQSPPHTFHVVWSPGGLTGLDLGLEGPDATSFEVREDHCGGAVDETSFECVFDLVFAPTSDNLLEHAGRAGARLREIGSRVLGCRGGACATGRCFAAGTLVLAVALGTTPVEALEVGDRVHATDESACEPTTSRDLVRVSIVAENAVAAWDTIYVDLLLDRSEAGARGYVVGGSAWLDHDAFSIHGWGEVVAVEDVDPEEGEGCLVVATISHLNSDLLRLRISGSDEEILVTAREDWIPAAELELGEEVGTSDGPALVESIEALHELRQIFNLVVEGSHEYLVGDSELRVHNGGPCDRDLTAAAQLINAQSGAWAAENRTATAVASRRMALPMSTCTR